MPNRNVDVLNRYPIDSESDDAMLVNEAQAVSEMLTIEEVYINKICCKESDLSS